MSVRSNSRPVSMLSLLVTAVAAILGGGWLRRVEGNSCIAITSGNWATAAVWTSCGGVAPRNGLDTADIPGVQVTVAASAAPPVSITVRGGGTLVLTGFTFTTAIPTLSIPSGQTGTVRVTSSSFTSVTTSLISGTFISSFTGTGVLNIPNVNSGATVQYSSSSTSGGLTVRGTMAGVIFVSTSSLATLTVASTATVSGTVTANSISSRVTLTGGAILSGLWNNVVGNGFVFSNTATLGGSVTLTGSGSVSFANNTPLSNVVFTLATGSLSFTTLQSVVAGRVALSLSFVSFVQRLTPAPAYVCICAVG